MRSDRSLVVGLRKIGKSYNEIRRLVNIPKSTLSDWLRGYYWSKTLSKNLDKKHRQANIVRIRYLNRVRGKHLKRLYRVGRKEALEEFESLKYHPLFIAGVIAYWGEGDKVSRFGARIANTDPAMIRLFVNFLRHVCQIEFRRIRASILLYPDLDSILCKKYWVTNSGLRNSSFGKSTVIHGRHKTRRVRYGICNVGISSAYFKQKLLIWVDLLSKALISKKYYLRS